MTQLERQNPPSSSMVGSEPAHVAIVLRQLWSVRLATTGCFYHNANVKFVCYDGEVASTCPDKF